MMHGISMRSAWNQGVALLFGDRRTAAIYLGLALVIPFLLFSIHDGSNFRTFFALIADQGVFAASSETPWTILSLFLFSSIAYVGVAFAWWNAVLPASRDGVIGEVMYGLVAALISVIIAFAMYVTINLPFALMMAMVATAIESGSISPLPMLVIGLLNAMALLWFNARLCMAGPAMAATGGLNPFPALARSWRLTGQAQWRIFFYLLLFQLIGLGVMALFITAGVGLIVGTYDFGWQDRVITLGWMLVELALMALYLIVSGGLYRELANDTDVTAFE
ncbi:hypothetical protein GV829_08370 [Sphingomonas lacunae]|uniref:Uncharacterized protein n=1 Tax=Sphingomonas lacunae TaxID=2698828 RepID=A0A6M4AWN5_9SPHN|nr:hypothetical protein [Sphingomonas lacunae]QJQ32459.1 hypothetical protein GV829_08370 [Sphingomonas lacunae]